MSSNNFSFEAEGNYGWTAFAVTLILICILSTAFGLCLRAAVTTTPTKKKIRKVSKTVIRHRDPTQIVRDFENEDQLDDDQPLEYDAEIIEIEEEEIEEFDTGFDTKEENYRKGIKPRPLDITKLHEQIKIEPHEGRIYRTQREINLVCTSAYTHLRGLMPQTENEDPDYWLDPGYTRKEIRGYRIAKERQKKDQYKTKYEDCWWDYERKRFRYPDGVVRNRN